MEIVLPQRAGPADRHAAELRGQCAHAGIRQAKTPKTPTMVDMVAVFFEPGAAETVSPPPRARH